MIKPGHESATPDSSMTLMGFIFHEEDINVVMSHVMRCAPCAQRWNQFMSTFQSKDPDSRWQTQLADRNAEWFNGAGGRLGG